MDDDAPEGIAPVAGAGVCGVVADDVDGSLESSGPRGDVGSDEGNGFAMAGDLAGGRRAAGAGGEVGGGGFELDSGGCGAAARFTTEGGGLDP